MHLFKVFPYQRRCILILLPLSKCVFFLLPLFGSGLWKWYLRGIRRLSLFLKSDTVSARDNVGLNHLLGSPECILNDLLLVPNIKKKDIKLEQRDPLGLSLFSHNLTSERVIHIHWLVLSSWGELRHLAPSLPSLRSLLTIREPSNCSGSVLIPLNLFATFGILDHPSIPSSIQPNNKYFVNTSG